MVFGAALFSVLMFFSWDYFQRRAVENAFTKGAAAVVAKMTLEEKVGQLFHVNLTGKKTGPAIEEEIRKRHVGGVILFGPNIGTAEELKALNTSMQELSRDSGHTPLLVSTDQEGGRVVRIVDGVTQFPGAMALGQAGDPRHAEAAGFMTGFELRRLGLPLVLAPVLDVNNNPANPVINTRSFGSTPERVSETAVAYMRGVRRSLAIPVVKHFPGHGNTDTDSHLALPQIDRSMEELEKVELVPFRRAVTEGAEAVMTAHILFRALDPDRPATLSPLILKGLLREKLGFKGIIISDAMEMHAVAKRYSKKEAARMAFEAGVDVILITGPSSKEMYDGMLSLFQKGELPLAELDQSVLSQVTLKLRRGLFHKNGVRLPDEVKDEDDLLREHFQKIEAGIEEAYGRVAALPLSANAEASRASVSALRREFKGLTESKDRIIVYYRSREAQEEARSIGVPESQIRPSPGPQGAFPACEKENMSCVVELWDTETAAWNAALAWREKPASGLSVSGRRPVVALYAGTPFTPLRVPADGAVLASFSPTSESRRALAHVVLTGKPVRKADLVLPPE